MRDKSALPIVLYSTSSWLAYIIAERYYGGLISGARFKRYQHADTQHLNTHLNKASGNKLIVTDGVFSMDGDFAPLADLVKVAKAHDAWLMVDDAHGFGVLGAKGGGLAECVGLSQTDLPILASNS